jgi:hypothetical protein
MRLNQNGTSIAEVTVSAATVVTLALASASFYNYYNQQDDQAKYKQTAVMLRQEVLGLLSNEDSWSKTVALNIGAHAEMKCLDPEQKLFCDNGATANSISVYDAQGTVIIDGTNATAGFTKYGKPCTTFDGVNGDDSCPIQIKVGWKAACAQPMDSWNAACCKTPGASGGATCNGLPQGNCRPTISCKTTQSLLQSTFSYKPKSGLTQLTSSLAKYNIVDLPRVTADAQFGPSAFCASKNLFYWPRAVGNARLRALSGEIDSNGCIRLCRIQDTCL